VLSYHLGWQEQRSPGPSGWCQTVLGARVGKAAFLPLPLSGLQLNTSLVLRIANLAASELLSLLTKANTPPPLITALKDVPVGQAAKAIYSWNKAGPGVAVPGLAPFETSGRAAAAWVPACTLLCINIHANWASAGRGSVWLNGTQTKMSA